MSEKSQHMPDWSRRAFLASVGVAALAGCSGRGDGSGSPTPSQTDTPDAGTPTATPSATATPTETPTPDADPKPPESVDADWPLPAYDPGRSNYTPESSGPTEQVGELWQTSADAALSGPVVVDGTVYVGGEDGLVRAIDARTGAGRWKQSVATTAGTPRASGDVLYIPAREAIHALDAADGTARWQADVGPIGDLVVASHGLYAVAAETPTVVAFDHDGTERWRTTIGDPWQPTVFAGETRVFVPTGTHSPQPWKLAVETGEVRNARRPGSGADFPESRFYHAGTVVAVDGFFGNLQMIQITETGVDWSVGLDGAGKFALAGGTDRIYATHMDYEAESARLFARSLSDGSLAWELTGLGKGVGRPVVAGDAVLVAIDDRLYCVDPEEGNRRWTYDGGIGEQFLVVEDLVVTTVGSTVHALRPP